MYFFETTGLAGLGAVTPGPGDVPVQGGYIRTNPNGSQCFLNAFLGDPVPGGFCFPIATCPDGWEHPYAAPLTCEDLCLSRAPDGGCYQWKGGGSGCPTGTFPGPALPSGVQACVPVGGTITGADGLDCVMQAAGHCTTVAPGVGYDRVKGCVRQPDGTCLPVPAELKNYVEVWGITNLAYLSDPKNLKSQPKTETGVWVPAVMSPGPRAPTPQERAHLDDAGPDEVDWAFGGSVLLPFYKFTMNGHDWAAIYTPLASETRFNGAKWAGQAVAAGMPWLPGTMNLLVWEGSGEAAIGDLINGLFDFLTHFGCDGVLGNVGKAFADAYGMGALHDQRCGKTTGGGTSTSSGFPTWGYFAAGGVLLAGLATAALWPRKKKAEAGG